MQKKSFDEFKNENESLIKLLEDARNGNKNALENILILFNDYIYSLCKYISMPKEEAVQELYLELMEIIFNKDISEIK